MKTATQRNDGLTTTTTIDLRAWPLIAPCVQQSFNDHVESVFRAVCMSDISDKSNESPQISMRRPVVLTRPTLMWGLPLPIAYLFRFQAAAYIMI
jgi:hypothetical protein